MLPKKKKKSFSERGNFLFGYNCRNRNEKQMSGSVNSTWGGKSIYLIKIE